MHRFELDPAFRSGYSSYTHEYYRHWDPTVAERALIEWLQVNVGKLRGYSYTIPSRAEGWTIEKGYSGDDHLADYSWRHITLRHYEPKGMLGHWLQVDDDEKAVLLRLSGVLDPCLYDPSTQHSDTEVMLVRKTDPNYPRYLRR